MAAVASPGLSCERRLQVVRQKLLSSPDPTAKLTGQLVERKLMRAVLEEGGDSRMRGFYSGSIPDAVVAYGTGPTGKADRVHREAAKLFGQCAMFQAEHLDAYGKRATKGDSQGEDPVKYLTRGLGTLEKQLASPVAKAQSTDWTRQVTDLVAKARQHVEALKAPAPAPAAESESGTRVGWTPFTGFFRY